MWNCSPRLESLSPMAEENFEKGRSFASPRGRVRLVRKKQEVGGRCSAPHFPISDEPNVVAEMRVLFGFDRGLILKGRT